MDNNELEQILSAQARTVTTLKWILGIFISICGLILAGAAISIPLAVEMHTQIEDLNRQFIAATSERDSLHGDLKTLRDNHDDLQGRFMEVQQEVLALRGKVSELTMLNTQLQRDKERLLGENAALLEQVRDLSQQNSGLISQIQTLQAQGSSSASEASAEIARLNKEIEANQARIAAALEQTTANFEQLKKAEWNALLSHVVLKECGKRISERRSDECVHRVASDLEARRAEFDACFKRNSGASLYFEGAPSMPADRLVVLKRGFVDFCGPI